MEPLADLRIPLGILRMDRPKGIAPGTDGDLRLIHTRHPGRYAGRFSGGSHYNSLHNPTHPWGRRWAPFNSLISSVKFQLLISACAVHAVSTLAAVHTHAAARACIRYTPTRSKWCISDDLGSCICITILFTPMPLLNVDLGHVLVSWISLWLYYCLCGVRVSCSLD